MFVKNTDTKKEKFFYFVITFMTELWYNGASRYHNGSERGIVSAQYTKRISKHIIYYKE